MSPLARLCVIAISFVLAPLVLAGRAEAGVLAADAAHCEVRDPSRPFERWLDYANYVPVAGGAFAAGAPGWELAGATVVMDNEPWRVDGSDAVGALQLPAGASATSPRMCADVFHPTMRFFARNAGDADGRLRVEVLFNDLEGTPRALTIGNLQAGEEWKPTPVLPVIANLLSLVTGKGTEVAFRFTARGGHWRVDGVYLDPWGKY